jgi:hypothetical protein
VLTAILKKSRKPLSGSELAERALAAGYQTQSTKFVDSIWTALGQMDNVEHLPQQGYRLKKGLNRFQTRLKYRSRSWRAKRIEVGRPCGQ